MKIDQLVSDAFADHEHLAPPADELLAGVQARLERPRAGGWPMALTAAVTVVAIAGGSAWGVVTLRGRQHPPAGQQQSAATPSTRSSARTSVSAATVRPNVAKTGATGTPATVQVALTMPFDVSWLPAGSVQYLARRINIGGPNIPKAAAFDGEYMLEVTTTTGKLDVDVQQMPGDLSGVHFKSGPGAAITVNGRSGIESANAAGPGGYEIWFDDASGRVMYVNVAAPAGQTAPAARLTSVGRQIAQGIRYPGTNQVTPTFGLAYIPAGLKIQAFDVENIDGQYDSTPAAQQTRYDLGTPASRLSGVDVSSGSVAPPTGRAGRTVQGHRTRYSTDDGYTTLFVLNAVHSGAVQIAGFRSLAELYRIAEGLVLPR